YHCDKCGKTMDRKRKREHRCFQTKCKNCKGLYHLIDAGARCPLIIDMARIERTFDFDYDAPIFNPDDPTFDKEDKLYCLWAYDLESSIAVIEEEGGIDFEIDENGFFK